MPSIMQRRAPALVPAAVACSFLGGQLFVPAMHGPATAAQPAGLVAGTPSMGLSNGAVYGAVATLSACSIAALAVSRPRAAKTRRAAFEPALEPGATEPLGFFDPLGFTKGKDEANFRKFRVAEIKHGRVAMMASIGTVLSHSVKLPGFEKVPAGLGALTDGAALPGLVGIFLVSGILELVLWKDDPSKDPGNFGDPLSWGKAINVERTYELNNGRMAMLAVLGQFAAELATGKDAVEQLRVA